MLNWVVRASLISLILSGAAFAESHNDQERVETLIRYYEIYFDESREGYERQAADDCFHWARCMGLEFDVCTIELSPAVKACYEYSTLSVLKSHSLPLGDDVEYEKQYMKILEENGVLYKQCMLKNLSDKPFVECFEHCSK